MKREKSEPGLLGPLKLPNQTENLDLEKTLFQKFKPGKYLMSIKSPSGNKYNETNQLHGICSFSSNTIGSGKKQNNKQREY